MIKFSHYNFEELSNKKLYEILQLRSKIFVIEQKCLYQDLDNLDQNAYHILVEKNNKLIGYSRIIKKGELFPKFCSIGRVLVDKEEREKKTGDDLVDYCVKTAKKLFDKDPIKISAQSYLIKFYKKHGFKYKGDDYLEDGIPHSAMFLE